MGIEWFLIPTLSGYWFLTHLNLTRYRILRDSGYHIFFGSAFTGGILVIFARILTFSLNECFVNYIKIWEALAPFPYSGTALLSVCLGIGLPPIANFFYSKEKAAKRNALRSGDLIEFLIAKSIQEQKLIAITLRSGKSYIGFARESCISSHGETDVALIPMASGYRDKDSQELKITTYYAAMIEDSLSRDPSLPDLSLEDFEIVFPMAEIISARIFDFEVYEAFQDYE